MFMGAMYSFWALMMERIFSSSNPAVSQASLNVTTPPPEEIHSRTTARPSRA
jgi:hypothetical protein